MDQNKNVSLAVQPKKKKKHTGLWITLGVIFALIVAPISAFYICFYDGNTMPTVKDPNFKGDNVFQNAFVDSLDNVKETSAMDIKVNKYTLNQLLYIGYEEMVKQNNVAKTFVKGVYIETSNDTYTFLIDLNAFNIFKTRIRLICGLEEGKINNEDCFIFNIKDLAIGRINGLYGVSLNLFGGFINDAMFEDAFKQFGLSFVSELKNNRIYYKKSSIYSDITKKVAIDNKMFSNILKQMFSSPEFSIKFAEDGLDAKMNLSTYHTNVNFLTESKKNTVNWPQIKSNVLTLVNNNIIQEADYQDAFNYLIKGYTYCSSAQKSKFETKDLTSIGISDPKTYNGVWTTETLREANKIIRPDKNLKDLMAAQINLTDIAVNKKIGEINEDQLNQNLITSGIIGETFTLNRKEGNTYKVNPVIVNDFYSNILKDSIKMVLSISINGYDTYLCFDAKYKEFVSSSYKISYTIDDVYLGENKASSDVTDSLYDLLSSYLNLEYLSFDKTNKTMNLSFAKAIDDSGYKTYIELAGTPAYEATGDSLADLGKVSLKIN